MFDKMTIAIEKGSLVGLLGLALAIYALNLIQRSFTVFLLHNHSPSTNIPYARGTALFSIGILTLLAGITIILNSERVLILLNHKLEIFSRLLDYFYC